MGEPGFSKGWVQDLSLAIDSSGTPYVAYTHWRNPADKARVMRFNGTAWEQVGDGVSDDHAHVPISLAIDRSGMPYVAYVGWDESDKEYKASVRRWRVVPANHAPVANAGPNQSAVQGSKVCFDGSGSSDADNDPLTYFWTLAAKPAGSTAALDNPAAVKPCLKTDRIGTYIVSLTVNDGTVNSAPSTASAAAVSYADALKQLCPYAGPWSNHGQYVACVTQSAASFLRQRLITGQQMGAAVGAAATNKCGVPVKK